MSRARSVLGDFLRLEAISSAASIWLKRRDQSVSESMTQREQSP